MSQDDSKFELTSRSWQELSVAERRNKLLELEDACKQYEQVDIDLQEFLCEGVYVRHGLLKAGTTIVGEIHKKAQINIVSCGKIRVATDEGVKIITGPTIFISPAGVKRAGYVLEDTVWSTIHATTETDPIKRRAEFVANSYNELELKE